jgi:hypothetical protein
VFDSRVAWQSGVDERDQVVIEHAEERVSMPRGLVARDGARGVVTHSEPVPVIDALYRRADADVDRFWHQAFPGAEADRCPGEPEVVWRVQDVEHRVPVVGSAIARRKPDGELVIVAVTVEDTM